jgi:ABC-type hemin transport system substrate-binding protein
MKRWLAAIAVLLAWASGCRPAESPPARAAAPATASAPSRAGHTASSSPTTRAAPLPDRVVHPEIVPAERDVPCPRIVSAAPNVTEICAALGAAPCLVGRTRFCTYPPAVLAVPSIGALNDLNAETLLGLRPDLVVVAGTSRQVSERLERLGVRFESVPDTTLDDLFTAIGRIGALLHRPLTAAALNAGIRGDLDTVVACYTGAPHLRVLLLSAPLSDPPTQADAIGPGSFYDDLLRRAGHTNVAAPAGRAFAPLSLEFVLQANPDVIIELAPDAAQRPAGDADAHRVWAGVGPLRALATERIHVLIGPEHFVLGPRIAQTFDALCATIGQDHE